LIFEFFKFSFPIEVMNISKSKSGPFDQEGVVSGPSKTFMVSFSSLLKIVDGKETRRVIHTCIPFFVSPRREVLFYIVVWREFERGKSIKANI